MREVIMLISFDMETGKADYTDPEENAVYGREHMAETRDGEPMLGLQLQEYTWTGPEVWRRQ